MKARGVARIFQRGGHSRDNIRGSPTIYGLYRCSPSCISGLSRIIAAWRFILTKDKSRWRKYFTRKQILKKVVFSTMVFTAKILSWRFHHLNIVGCLLKTRPTKGGSRAPQDPPPPLATPLKAENETTCSNGWFDFLHLINLIERTTSLFHVYTVPVNAPHLHKNVIILITIIVIFIAWYCAN